MSPILDKRSQPLARSINMRLDIAQLYNRYVLKPNGTALVLGVIFGFFCWQAQYFALDASADSLILDNDRDLVNFYQVAQRYAEGEYLFLSYQPDAKLFSQAALKPLAKLRDEINALAAVTSVVSLLDVPLLKSSDVSLLEMENNVQTLEKPTVVLERAKAELLTSPIYRDLLISADGKITALQINLRTDSRYTVLRQERDRLRAQAVQTPLSVDEQRRYQQVLTQYQLLGQQINDERHQVIEQIRQIAKRYDDVGTLYLGGVPMIAADMITFIKSDLIVFGLGVLALLIVSLSVIFRRVRWVVLPLLSCVYAGVSMVGILGLVGWQVTVISSNFISLMLILTMSMNVHLIVRYRQLCRDYPDAKQADLVLLMVRKMATPCLYTALTTLLAFASLTVSGIKPVVHFGAMMSIGLVVVFVTTFTLFPTLLLRLPRSQVAMGERDTYPVTRWLASLTQKQGGSILGVAVLLAVVAWLGVSMLRVENSFINYFDQDTEIYQGMKLLDEHLGGTTPLDIIIDLKEPSLDTEDPLSEPDALEALLGISVQKEDTWFTAYKIDTLRKIHDYLDNQKEIGKVMSLIGPIRVAEELNDGQPLDSLALAVMYKKIPQSLRHQMIDPYIDIERDEARIHLRVKDSLPDLRRRELIERLHTGLQNELGLKPDQYQITGILILYNNMLQSLFSSQIETLGTVMSGIFIMLVVLFRSIKLAVIGILPNVLSAVVVLGSIGLLGIALDMMTITIAAITIGIAIDNAIHYIYRFREELPLQSGDYLQTLHYCHNSIGKAVFYTAVIIVAGFSILLLSNFVPTTYFGFFTALALMLALLASLTVLPKLILMIRPF